MKIKIKPGLEIGEGCPPFIVAEIGSNWRTLEDCLSSIRIAKACGADAAKFQLYDSDALYGGNPGGYLEQLLALEKTALPVGWLPKLHTECQKVGIEFMVTAFSPELIEVVDPYVSIHKVASAELTHIRMLEKLRKIGKPVFLSTGASGATDIKLALKVLGHGTYDELEGPTPSIVLMYCVAAYPARYTDLGRIKALQTIQPLRTTLVGYSDHSLDALLSPGLAVHHYGACVVEKHVNFTDHTDTPDAPHSLSEREFRAMVKHLREPLRVPEIMTTPDETPMVLRHNRRLIATREIEAGETLQEGVNFGIYRALQDEPSALSPWTIAYVNGQTACVKIAAGKGITPNAIQKR